MNERRSRGRWADCAVGMPDWTKRRSACGARSAARRNAACGRFRRASLAGIRRYPDESRRRRRDSPVQSGFRAVLPHGTWGRSRARGLHGGYNSERRVSGFWTSASMSRVVIIGTAGGREIHARALDEWVIGGSADKPLSLRDSRERWKSSFATTCRFGCIFGWRLRDKSRGVRKNWVCAGSRASLLLERG